MTVNEAYKAAAEADAKAAQALQAAHEARGIADKAEQSIDELLQDADQKAYDVDVLITAAKKARERATDLHMASIAKQAKGTKDV